MDLTEENIKKLKSLVRVSMDMHDYENWKNGEYFGDARKFWDGAMQGIDMWVDKMRESQKLSTSDEALPIDMVVGRSEQSCKHPDSCAMGYYHQIGDYYCSKCQKTGLQD